MENSTQNTWRNNLKMFLGLLSSAVVFGTIFNSIGYNNALNDMARDNQTAIKEAIKDGDDDVASHSEDENEGARADQERADIWIMKITDLKIENEGLRIRLENCKNKNLTFKN